MAWMNKKSKLTRMSRSWARSIQKPQLCLRCKRKSHNLRITRNLSLFVCCKSLIHFLGTFRPQRLVEEVRLRRNGDNEGTKASLTVLVYDLDVVSVDDPG